MKRKIAVALGCAILAGPALAAPGIDEAYVKSLAAPGKTVLVIEYYDSRGEVTDRKGFASASGYKAVSPTQFQVDRDIAINLYGLEPCDGEMVNRTEDYAGSCAGFAQAQLEVLLKSPKVLFCRAFLSELGAPHQNATCYGYYNFPGSLDTVDMLEEQLVSLGALRVAKGTDGAPLRSDLIDAEIIGQKGSYGMWADPRVQAQ
jgi:hypothetical protein